MVNDNIEDELLLAKLDTLWKSVINSVIIGTIISFIITYYVRDHAPKNILYVWLALVFLGSAIRLIFRKIYLTTRDKFPLKTWLNIYFLSTSYIATLFAVLTFIYDLNMPAEKQLVVTCIFLGLASGGAISSIADKKTAIYYSSSIIFFFLIKTLVYEGEEALFFIIAMILFIYLIIKMIFNFNLLYTQSILSNIELSKKIDLERELQAEKNKSYQASRLASLGELAAGIAHEINNPLTVSLGKVQLLQTAVKKDKATSEFIDKSLSDMVNAHKRISDIVFSMRNLSRMQAEPQNSRFNSQELFKVVTPLIKTKIRNYGIHLIEEVEQVELVGDIGEISQVFLNLIQNSIDEIAELQDRWIKITSKIEGDFFVIEQSDSGKEIPLEISEKIFEPFYTTKEVGKGTGLGLSLSKSIMERNSGSLDYKAIDGHPCFSVKIPIAA